jgi:hypothetical protein
MEQTSVTRALSDVRGYGYSRPHESAKLNDFLFRLGASIMTGNLFLAASLLPLGQSLVNVNAAETASKPVDGQPGPSQAALQPASPAIAPNYGKLPLSFEANQGQTDPQVKFLSKGNGYTLFLTDKAAVLSLTKTDQPKTDTLDQNQLSPCTSHSLDKNRFVIPTQAQRSGGTCIDNKSGCPIQAGGCIVGLSGKAQKRASSTTKTDIVRMELTGANQWTKVEGTEQLPGTANYFIGNDPARWHTNVPTYAKVSYKNVYPGIDLTYYGNQRQLEYDFIVKPGANPKVIRLHFHRAQKLKLNSAGDLTISGKNGEVVFHKPTVYQIQGGHREPVDGRFALLSGNVIQFAVGPFDPTRELVVDPELVYSTYLGSGDYVRGSAIAVDASGSAYVAGYVSDNAGGSGKIPVTAGVFQGQINSPYGSAFVTKFTPDGSGLVYSTYLGGSGNGQGDRAYGIAVDTQGNAYLTGQANSSNFPTTAGAFQTAASSTYNGAFVTKLNPTGTALVYSTYLSGSASNLANGIAVDALGDAYVTGQTNSLDFPVTANAFQTTNISTDHALTAFVTEFNPGGSGLIYSTYLGGSAQDEGAAIAVDSDGNAYVTGLTLGDFPVINAFQPTGSAQTAFVTKLNPTGTALIYSTYLGGSSFQSGTGIAVDATGSAYVTGTTSSTNFPVTAGAFQQISKDASGNAFITKFSPTGSSLIYSTYLGGDGDDSAYGIAVDSSGDAFVTGLASSTDFPVTGNAFQKTLKASLYNCFLTEINPNGTALLYSTYLGGNYQDFGLGVAVDLAGNAYMTGYASSTNFPVTSKAYQTSNQGHATFAARFALGSPLLSSMTSLYASANPAAVGVNVTFNAFVQPLSGAGTPAGTVAFSVDGGGGTTVTLDGTGHAVFSAGSFTAGSHTISAAYTGSSTYAASSTSLTENIENLVATPTFSPAAGTYASAHSISILDSTNGSAIYYTTDGTTPTTSSSEYVSPITVLSNLTIEAIAAASGYANSAVASASYIIGPLAPLQFIPATPCRIADTRNPAGPFGGPEPAAGSTTTFNIPQSVCNIPSNAVAYSLNVTVVPNGSLNYLTMWPAGQPQPNVSTLNSDGRVKANAAIVPAGANGAVSVFVSDPTNVILDIDGYFVPAGTASALAFYPVTPCRIADTRQADGPLGGPQLASATSRAFPIQSSACGLPPTAQAYSLNITAIPQRTLNYLTSWPTGQAQPYVSTLNSSTGAVTANAAIVPAGTTGEVSIFVSDDADVILDVNGYFAPLTTGGLSLYTTNPCRVIDTRPDAFIRLAVVNLEGSPCAPPSTALAYVLNATVVPTSPLNYLTLWPDGAAQPYVSTLNADDAAVTSNMAIVPTTNGSIDAYAAGTTNLILDLSSYFAP